MAKKQLAPGELRDGRIPVRNKNGVMVGHLGERATQASALRMLGGGNPKLTNKSGRLEWRNDCGDDDEDQT